LIAYALSLCLLSLPPPILMPPVSRVAQGVEDALDVVGESIWNLFLVIARKGLIQIAKIL